MLESAQIEQIAIFIWESGTNLEDMNQVNELIGLLLENIAGCECLSDDEISTIQQHISEIIEKLQNG